MVAACPPEMRCVLERRGSRWPLTLSSVHAQMGERRKLDLVTSELPAECTCHGWLGDSVLCKPPPGMDMDEFCRSMLPKHGIIVTQKPLPRTEAEYFAMLSAIVPRFDRTEVSERARERVEAREYAARFLRQWGDASENGEKRPATPSLMFAIALEEHVPAYRCWQTEDVQYYCATEGEYFFCV